jgi:APA family basic amino acid/polyamine antiporter
MPQLRTKSIDALIAAAEDPARRLRKTLGPWSLTGLGIGAVIGGGIFILTGTAAAGETLAYKSILHAPVLDLLMHGSGVISTMGRQGAGPAISLSFILTAIFRGIVLCGAGVDDSCCRDAYTYSRDARRDLRLDHRLGSDP